MTNACERCARQYNRDACQWHGAEAAMCCCCCNVLLLLLCCCRWRVCYGRRPRSEQPRRRCWAQRRSVQAHSGPRTRVLNGTLALVPHRTFHVATQTSVGVLVAPSVGKRYESTPGTRVFATA